MSLKSAPVVPCLTGKESKTRQGKMISVKLLQSYTRWIKAAHFLCRCSLGLDDMNMNTSEAMSCGILMEHITLSEGHFVTLSLVPLTHGLSTYRWSDGFGETVVPRVRRGLSAAQATAP